MASVQPRVSRCGLLPLVCDGHRPPLHALNSHALEQLREFDGKDAVLHADRMHFWPYGLNFDNESSKENDVRHVKMVMAMRKDMGID